MTSPLFQFVVIYITHIMSWTMKLWGREWVWESYLSDNFLPRAGELPLWFTIASKRNFFLNLPPLIFMYTSSSSSWSMFSLLTKEEEKGVLISIFPSLEFLLFPLPNYPFSSIVLEFYGWMSRRQESCIKVDQTIFFEIKVLTKNNFMRHINRIFSFHKCNTTRPSIIKMSKSFQVQN